MVFEGDLNTETAESRPDRGCHPSRARFTLDGELTAAVKSTP